MSRLAALCLIVWLNLSCAVGMTTHPTFTPQRFEQDCAVAVLAMAAHVSYEKADKARERANVPFNEGMTESQIEAAGAKLGLHFTYQKTYNPTTDRGVIVYLQPHSDTAHAVYLEGGDVYDPLALHSGAWVMVRHNFDTLLYFLKQ